MAMSYLRPFHQPGLLRKSYTYPSQILKLKADEMETASIFQLKIQAMFLYPDTVLGYRRSDLKIVKMKTFAYHDSNGSIKEIIIIDAGVNEGLMLSANAGVLITETERLTFKA